MVGAGGDDQGFMQALIKDVESDQCLDHDHIFMSGFSMGGYFSNETGCVNPTFRAVGPHSGGTHDLAMCTSTHRPVILFHGTADSLISVDCGKDARMRWAAHNGCSTDVDMLMVKGGHCEVSKGCPADGQVELCLFDGMDHGWAGGAAGQAFSYPDFESASELGWKFFKEHAW